MELKYSRKIPIFVSLKLLIEPYGIEILPRRVKPRQGLYLLIEPYGIEMHYRGRDR